MAYGFVGIVHIVAAVFSIIELGLTGYVISFSHGFSASQVNFMLFNSIWSLLVLAYVGLTPLYATHLFHKLASLALEALTMLFWFAGSIALAVLVGGPWNCAADTVCGSIEAAIAFGFFLWALFGFLTVLDTIEAMRSRGHGATTHHTHTTTTAAGPGHKPYVGA